VTHRREARLEHGFIQNTDQESAAAGDRLFSDIRKAMNRPGETAGSPRSRQ